MAGYNNNNYHQGLPPRFPEPQRYALHSGQGFGTLRPPGSEDLSFDQIGTRPFDARARPMHPTLPTATWRGPASMQATDVAMRPSPGFGVSSISPIGTGYHQQQGLLSDSKPLMYPQQLLLPQQPFAHQQQQLPHQHLHHHQQQQLQQQPMFGQFGTTHSVPSGVAQSSYQTSSILNPTKTGVNWQSSLPSRPPQALPMNRQPLTAPVSAGYSVTLHLTTPQTPAFRPGAPRPYLIGSQQSMQSIPQRQAPWQPTPIKLEPGQPVPQRTWQVKHPIERVAEVKKEEPDAVVLASSSSVGSTPITSQLSAVAAQETLIAPAHPLEQIDLSTPAPCSSNPSMEPVFIVKAENDAIHDMHLIASESLMNKHSTTAFLDAQPLPIREVEPIDMDTSPSPAVPVMQSMTTIAAPPPPPPPRPPRPTLPPAIAEELQRLSSTMDVQHQEQPQHPIDVASHSSLESADVSQGPSLIPRGSIGDTMVHIKQEAVDEPHDISFPVNASAGKSRPFLSIEIPDSTSSTIIAPSTQQPPGYQVETIEPITPDDLVVPIAPWSDQLVQANVPTAGQHANMLLPTATAAASISRASTVFNPTIPCSTIQETHVDVFDMDTSVALDGSIDVLSSIQKPRVADSEQRAMQLADVSACNAPSQQAQGTTSLTHDANQHAAVIQPAAATNSRGDYVSAHDKDRRVMTDEEYISCALGLEKCLEYTRTPNKVIAFEKFLEPPPEAFSDHIRLYENELGVARKELGEAVKAEQVRRERLLDSHRQLAAFVEALLKRINKGELNVDNLSDKLLNVVMNLNEMAAHLPRGWMLGSS